MCCVAMNLHRRIPPLRTYLHHFLISNKGQVRILNATALLPNRSKSSEVSVASSISRLRSTTSILDKLVFGAASEFFRAKPRLR